MLRKVISGGQTGVDVAALRAAAAMKLLTGGTMPKGFRTSEGPHPDWAQQFGLRESPIANYAARTEVNVVDAQATLILCAGCPSPGVRCTWNAIERHDRPRLEVPLAWIMGAGWTFVSGTGPSNCGDLARSMWAGEAIRWIQTHTIEILNVAGHSERTAPGIEAFIEPWLRAVFTDVA